MDRAIHRVSKRILIRISKAGRIICNIAEIVWEDQLVWIILIASGGLIEYLILDHSDPLIDYLHSLRYKKYLLWVALLYVCYRGPDTN